MQAPSENPKFWGTLFEAQEDKFYQGLNSIYFDQASPAQRQEWLNFHLQRMLNDVEFSKHFRSKDDAIYMFNALIILYWNGLIRPNRPEMPQLPHGPITVSRYIDRARVINTINSIDFDSANPEQRRLMLDQLIYRINSSPSRFNVKLPEYWNPKLRPNRPPPPYLKPEFTLNYQPITGNIEQDINSENFDLCTAGEFGEVLTYYVRLSTLPIKKFNNYLKHIWIPHYNRKPLTLLTDKPRRPGIRFKNYPWPKDSVIEDVEIYGKPEDADESCPRDEDNEITDVISMSPIPMPQLVRIRTNGVLHCYNLKTLIEINNSTGIDPLTRIPFTRDLREDIFKLQLASLGLQETAETREFRLQNEADFQNFEGLLNDTNLQYSDVVDKYRKSLNDLRAIVRSAIIVTLSQPDTNMVEEMQYNQTIVRMLDDLYIGFRRETD